MLRAAMATVVAMALAGGASTGSEIGFIEDFALAKDRTKPLQQLIPGTEDYYYYHCLHYQNTGQFDKVEELLKLWIKRYKHTARVKEIRNRQALLTYEKDPSKSLEFLRWRLRLHFNHQRELLDKMPKLPTRLDPKLIARERLMKRAFGNYQNLQEFEDSALEWLAVVKLNGDRRRDLLRRLKRPDLAYLPRLVVADLDYKHSRGFGSHEIHRKLLLSQLGELLKLKPNLLNETRFVETYLTKLHPSSDVDWKHDPQARKVYLERLWKFVARLAPVHNSLKAHVLYHRLVFDRSRGVYDKDRFMTYIKLPRNAVYVNRKYLARPEHTRRRVNLKADFRQFTLLPPVGNDEPLVRSYLLHFFVGEDNHKPYMAYINDIYLKECFAEAKIVNGIGDMEQWYSMLPPAKYKALKERIDLDFAPTNKTVFAPDEDVHLDLYVKNVQTLIVKVYEINTMNYYRERRTEVGTDINLDGLVANTEKVHKYKEPPLRRVKRSFEFPTLKKRGVFIVELIGNGKSSRGLIRKGKLRFLERIGTAGHVFTILDESNRKVNDAKLWVSGHEYTPEEDGTITVPFSTKPGRQPIIISKGNFASLDSFHHLSENYSLKAGIHVEREALLTGGKATVAIRPALYVNDTPVTLSVLEDVKLLIQSIDHDGVATTKEVPKFKLFEDTESVYEFQVPERLSRISFALKAKVKNLSQNKKVDLVTGAAFDLNQIDKTHKVEDLHLGAVNGEYLLDVLGKNGEVKANRPVQLRLKHRDFRQEVHVTLQTDAGARVVLGALKDIDRIRATGPEGTAHQWVLPRDSHTYPLNVSGKAGESIYIPYMGAAKEPKRSELSMLEVRDGTYVNDFFDALRIKDGFLVLEDLPGGDYELAIKRSDTRIRIYLTDGDPREGYILSGTRHLQSKNPNPLQIVNVDPGRDKITIRLANATKFARVHVAATRYAPEYSISADLGAIPFAEPHMIRIGKMVSLYLSGRNIGDEYRYIIDRKYAKKFPGNILKRPMLLLNPWAIRKTDAGREVAREGEAWSRKAEEAKPIRAPAPSKPVGRKRGDNFANLDFLAEQGVLLTNLRPDENGVVTIERKDLGAHQQLHIVAADPINTVYRAVSLPEQERRTRELRLVRGLDPEKHYTEQKQISAVAPGKKLIIPDVTTSKFEAYDDLARAYNLYVTLSNNATLREFGFILNWGKLPPEEKRKMYSKYASHELTFFLYKKDPEFFRTVIQPYLRNKKDKTFLDHWLLGDDLSYYLNPWAHAQLNIVERILLSRRIRQEQAYTVRHVKDLFDLIPPDIDRFNHLFDTALKGRALETTISLGVPVTMINGKIPIRGELDKMLHVVKPAAANGRPSAPAVAREAEAIKDKRRARSLSELRARSDKLAAKDDAREGYFAGALRRRAGVRAYYRKLEKTQEWVENNYYHLPIESQNAELITVNAFWNDYAAYDGDGPFLSVHLAEASRNFPEMMLALSVLDLPSAPEEHKTEYSEKQLTLEPATPLVLFHKEIKPAREAPEKPPILVSQNFFRHGDRYRHVNNERIDKFVTDEFLARVVYGAHVVVTNPTSSKQKLDVLLQVPRGAIPVANGKYTRSVRVDLEPYRTQTYDYYFYFPAAGKYQHYPLHVAENGQLVAFAAPHEFNVVEKLSKIDTTSWDYISQHGTPQQVLGYLKEQNLNRIKLSRIAWRMQDKGYFRNVIAILTQRHLYDQTLWSYGIKHNDVPVIREFLQHCDSFVKQCGEYIDSKLLRIDPVVRKIYQHMEYSPLVNARAHKLGKKRRIVNERLSQQYHRLMKVLGYRPQLDDDDLMGVTYYMLLQDRVEDALGFFGRVKAENLPTRIQHDYFTAYIDFYLDKPPDARKITEKYKDYPVDRWRKLFAAVASQLDELEGKGPKVVDTKDRAEVQAKLADTSVTLDLKVEGEKITLQYQNVRQCLVNYYQMDIELLFSRNPFVQRYSGEFAFIRPNASAVVQLPVDKTSHTFELPKEFHNSNVMVEVIAGGVKRSQAYFSHSLGLKLMENYGQVKVTDGKTDKPLPKVYVKVYARMRDGTMRFYKDGYTDLRGRFDYTSLNTDELDRVEKFSLLILSETNGAVVREANPPKR